MKLPRNIGGSELITLLRRFGYEQTRQVGSHIRLTTNVNGTHQITVPNHNPIRIGTLNSILNDVASHRRVTKEDIINELFR